MLTKTHYKLDLAMYSWEGIMSVSLCKHADKQIGFCELPVGLWNRTHSKFLLNSVPSFRMNQNPNGTNNASVFVISPIQRKDPWLLQQGSKQNANTNNYISPIGSLVDLKFGCFLTVKNNCQNWSEQPSFPSFTVRCVNNIRVPPNVGTDCEKDFAFASGTSVSHFPMLQHEPDLLIFILMLSRQ